METRPFASWKEFCLCCSLLSLSCSRACTAGLFSPLFTCRTIQQFSLALVQLLPLVFYYRIATLACCVASLKYLALSLSVDLMIRTTLVVLPALGFLFCVCLVLPPFPLLYVECGTATNYCSKFLFFLSFAFFSTFSFI